MSRLNPEVDKYICTFPDVVQEKLQEIRELILNAASGAEEVMSYGMPAYRTSHILVYFAGWKKHVGFYPTADGIAAFATELKSYEHSKGSVKFPLDAPLPHELITRIVEHRLRTTSG